MDSGRTFIGIPDHLGDGQLLRAGDDWPPLEDMCGEDWSKAVLAQLLPRERAWAWWTRTALYRKTNLATVSVPDTVDLANLQRLETRSLLLRRMTLAIVPANDQSAQDDVLYWAGADTEQIPDHIWTAPSTPTWNVDHVVSWCDDPAAWTDRQATARQAAERVVTMFDRRICCAVSADAADEIMRQLSVLADRWHLRVISGPSEYAWPSRAVV